MSDTFKLFLQNSQQRVEAALSAQLSHSLSNSQQQPLLQRLHDAMHYSLFNGGKRVRPMLVYAAAQAINSHSDAQDLDKAASAIEMIHSYSLVHDDLPAMDDDDLRRGKPTCHIAYDEATAILAGDALQALAFEQLASLNSSSDTRVALIRRLSQAAGPLGMVGGQAIDLASVNQQIDLPQLQTLHQLKTGALIRAAVSMGATVAGASAAQLSALDDYASAIGLAFQVTDDILDIESDTETLGKQQGADLALNKPTYPALLGLAGAKEKAQQLQQQALQALAGFDQAAQPLRDLAAYIITRKH
ncbi:polyprenyl synthetase family protein [Dasania sp. GY-MA-18]|uniref:Polyprenyl synthetase family protein n=1 Tax=Dasania phycosphaerae TaxID=2950436 RepID=A0A9J6RIA3_9GAMM|nr:MULTISPECIES: farnesyl diphosphate synthase [Dasania]MCR8921515.1 polyprenyl synthetase family protein [Dasania sp. GY-MA-18]MCZ0863943.1 polyprenyl synthetase family protein [Dasania phycosphaerae]MCZ0867671.1 polyprenyl synthetase family protein [Dasania phycosphaerae]